MTGDKTINFHMCKPEPKNCPKKFENVHLPTIHFSGVNVAKFRGKFGGDLEFPASVGFAWAWIWGSPPGPRMRIPRHHPS